MRRSSLAPAAAILLAAAATASAGPARKAGYIPNAFADRLADGPIREAKGVFDVYQAIVDWLRAVYPEDGKAAQALRAMDVFVRKHREGATANAGAVEMPLNIDHLLKVLRDEAPGVGGRAFRGDAATNPKAQLYTAMLLPAVHLRGITFRVRPLVSASYFLHTAGIGALRAAKQQLEVRSGTNGLALFHFFTYPMAQKGRGRVQFHSVSELQAWVTGHLIPTLDVSVAMIEGALAAMPAGKRESLDLGVFLAGDDPFPDATMEQGFRYFDRAEVHDLLSQFLGARAALRLGCAYDLDDLAAVGNKMQQVLTRRFFSEKFSMGKPRVGNPSQVRFAVVREFERFMTLKDPGQTRAALADLRGAWHHLDAAMNGYFAAKADERDERFTNIRWQQAGWREYQQKIAPQMAAALAGPASLNDYVGGAVIDVDVPGLLADPPRDLKDFFPTRFHDEASYDALDFSSGQLLYTNYDFGNPRGWDLAKAGDTWAKLFPGISREADAAGNWRAPLEVVRDAVRTYAGSYFEPVLSALVN